MHVGEYLLALAAIVLGLALTELAAGIDRLVKRRRDVIFHPAALLAAAMIFYIVIANLWAQYAHYRAVTQARLSEGFSVITTFMITYLLAALVLPDEWEGKVDLGDYYDSVRRPFWGLFGLNVVAVFITHMILRGGAAEIGDLITSAIGLAIAGTMIAVRNRKAQVALIATVFALQVFSFGDFTISG